MKKKIMMLLLSLIVITVYAEASYKDYIVKNSVIKKLSPTYSYLFERNRNCLINLDINSLLICKKNIDNELRIGVETLLYSRFNDGSGPVSFELTLLNVSHGNYFYFRAKPSTYFEKSLILRADCRDHSKIDIVYEESYGNTLNYVGKINGDLYFSNYYDSGYYHNKIIKVSQLLPYTTLPLNIDLKQFPSFKIVNNHIEIKVVNSSGVQAHVYVYDGNGNLISVN